MGRRHRRRLLPPQEVVIKGVSDPGGKQPVALRAEAGGVGKLSGCGRGDGASLIVRILRWITLYDGSN
jgi:hypothetical protein